MLLHHIMLIAWALRTHIIIGFDWNVIWSILANPSNLVDAIWCNILARTLPCWYSIIGTLIETLVACTLERLSPQRILSLFYLYILLVCKFIILCEFILLLMAVLILAILELLSIDIIIILVVSIMILWWYSSVNSIRLAISNNHNFVDFFDMVKLIDSNISLMDLLARHLILLLSPLGRYLPLVLWTYILNLLILN